MACCLVAVVMGAASATGQPAETDAPPVPSDAAVAPILPPPASANAPDIAVTTPSGTAPASRSPGTPPLSVPPASGAVSDIDVSAPPEDVRQAVPAAAPQSAAPAQPPVPAATSLPRDATASQPEPPRATASQPARPDAAAPQPQTLPLDPVGQASATETAPPAFPLTGRLLAFNHIARAASDLAGDALRAYLPLPALPSIADTTAAFLKNRLPLPNPVESATAFVLRVVAGLPVSAQVRSGAVLPIDLAALLPAGLTDAVALLQSADVTRFTGRLSPLLIPLAMFLTLLTTWRASFAGARSPAHDLRSTPPRVQPRTGAARNVPALSPVSPNAGTRTDHPEGLPQRARDRWTDAAPLIAIPADADPDIPAPDDAAPQRTAEPGAPGTALPLVAVDEGPVFPDTVGTQTTPPRDDPLGRLLAAPGADDLPPFRPGADPPLMLDGLAADEVLTILLSTPETGSRTGTVPEISLVPSAKGGATRVFLGADCIAVVTGQAALGLDQITVIFVAQDKLADPVPLASEPVARAAAQPAQPARDARRRATVSAAKEERSDNKTAQQTPSFDEITFDLDAAPADETTAAGAKRDSATPDALPAVLSRRSRRD